MARRQRSQRNLAVAFSLSAIVAFQLSTALSPPLFGRLGPSGVAALRLAVAAVILFAIVRPPLRAGRELLAPVCLGIATGVEFVIWFEAVARVPLGVVVAIGFIGPLTVAVADSRRLLDGLWAALAAGGILLLTLGHPTARPLNPTGLVFAFCCAGLWATYILLTKRVGERWAGFQGLAVALPVAALASMPFALANFHYRYGDLTTDLEGASLGLLVLLGYLLEFVAIKRLPNRVFGVLTSLEPVAGALLGLLVLGQRLTLAGSAAIALIVCATAGVTLTARDEPPAVPLID